MECQIPIGSHRSGGQASNQTPFAQSLNHTQVVLFDGSDGKLGVAVSTDKRVHWESFSRFPWRPLEFPQFSVALSCSSQ